MFLTGREYKITKANLSKSDLIRAAWRDFYDTLSTDVTSVTLADASTSTIQTYTNAFPDKTATSRSSYPILVINSPEINWSYFTLKKDKVMCSIDVEIYATSSEATARFADAIQNSIETNKDDLRAYNIMRLELDDTSHGEEFRGDIKVHITTLTFSFEFIFNKTRSW
jgi:hypothetical protein